MKTPFSDFFWKNFNRSIVPPFERSKHPLFNGGYGEGGGLPEDIGRGSRG